MRAVVEARADSLDAALASLDTALAGPASSRGAALDVRAEFRAARAQYKRVEGIVEFYAPALAAAFNSRRQEVDDDDAPPPGTLAPAGFPALETIAWPSVALPNAAAARTIIAGMRPAVRRLRGLGETIVPTDAQVIEIARLELARVSTLGIAGFDAPRTHDAMLESADALGGIRSLFDRVDGGWRDHRAAMRMMDSTFLRAEEYLRGHRDFDSFDRLAFIAEYSQPAAKALDEIRITVATTPIRMPRGWRADVASVYSSGAFDPHAYANSSAPPPTAAIVALGERLFNEPRLSGTGTRSCASCHIQSRAFTDGVAKAVNIHGAASGTVFRNTPTLINAGLQPAQFADERAVTLEDQVIEVLRSPAEMGGSIERASVALANDARYRAEFAGAFDSGSSGSVTPLRVRQALAAYVRSLVALNSRFDRAVRGDESVLTAEERHGFSLFMGKAGCGTCHFAPLFSGNTPPLYMSSDVEVIGTPASPARPATPDADSGRGRIDHLPAHVRAFKTPSLRNIALTAPYMHHGAFATLEDVLRFYDAGGGVGSGAKIANQTLSPDSLHLTAAERAAIIAFLGALSDTAGTGRRPPHGK